MPNLNYLAGSAGMAAAAVLGAADDDLRDVLPTAYGDRIVCAIPADLGGLPADVRQAIDDLLDLFPTVEAARWASLEDLRRGREAIVHLWRVAQAALQRTA